MIETTGPIRWGICGTGRIADKFVDGLAHVDDARVLAVGSRALERSAEFAGRHGIARSHGSYEELAADEELDVVYVATTQDGHHDAVLAMLAGGHHVLCEKPLALNEAQAATMIDTAARHERFLMEAMWSRFSPAYERLQRLIAENRIGEVLQVRADLSVNVPVDARATHRLYDLARGGGALLDVGIYPLQLASLLLGEPTSVKASGLLTDSGVDQRVAAVLDHSEGKLAVLSTAIDLDGGRQAVISGTHGTIELCAPMHATSRLILETGEGREVIDCAPPALEFQVPEVHRCIEEGLLESPVMPWAESWSLMRTTDDIRSQIGLRYPGE